MLEMVIQTVDRLQQSLDRLNTPVGKILIKTGSKLIPEDKLINMALAKAKLPDEVKLKILESLVAIANERQCSLVELILSKEVLEFIKTGCELAKDVKQIWIPEIEDSGAITNQIEYER